MVIKNFNFKMGDPLIHVVSYTWQSYVSQYDACIWAQRQRDTLKDSPIPFF